MDGGGAGLRARRGARATGAPGRCGGSSLHGPGPVDVTVPGRRARAGSRDPAPSLLTLLPGHCTLRKAHPGDEPRPDAGRPPPRPARDGGSPPRSRRPSILRLADRRAAGMHPTRTRSELERCFLRLCRRHRLPSEVQRARGSVHSRLPVAERRLIVETDGCAASIADRIGIRGRPRARRATASARVPGATVHPSSGDSANPSPSRRTYARPVGTVIGSGGGAFWTVCDRNAPDPGSWRRARTP